MIKNRNCRKYGSAVFRRHALTASLSGPGLGDRWPSLRVAPVAFGSRPTAAALHIADSGRTCAAKRLERPFKARPQACAPCSRRSSVAMQQRLRLWVNFCRGHGDLTTTGPTSTTEGPCRHFPSRPITLQAPGRDQTALRTAPISAPSAAAGRKQVSPGLAGAAAQAFDRPSAAASHSRRDRSQAR
jgi:hypothetical protein